MECFSSSVIYNVPPFAPHPKEKDMNMSNVLSFVSHDNFLVILLGWPKNINANDLCLAGKHLKLSSQTVKTGESYENQKKRITTQKTKFNVLLKAIEKHFPFRISGECTRYFSTHCQGNSCHKKAIDFSSFHVIKHGYSIHLSKKKEKKRLIVFFVLHVQLLYIFYFYDSPSKQKSIKLILIMNNHKVFFLNSFLFIFVTKKTF